MDDEEKRQATRTKRNATRTGQPVAAPRIAPPYTARQLLLRLVFFAEIADSTVTANFLAAHTDRCPRVSTVYRVRYVTNAARRSLWSRTRRGRQLPRIFRAISRISRRSILNFSVLSGMPSREASSMVVAAANSAEKPW